MTPTDAQLKAVKQALQRLREHYDAPSNYALARILKRAGLRTSSNTLWKWENGQWFDNDHVLIAALTVTLDDLPQPEALQAIESP